MYIDIPVECFILWWQFYFKCPFQHVWVKSFKAPWQKAHKTKSVSPTRNTRHTEQDPPKIEHEMLQTSNTDVVLKVVEALSQIVFDDAKIQRTIDVFEDQIRLANSPDEYLRKQTDLFWENTFVRKLFDGSGKQTWHHFRTSRTTCYHYWRSDTHLIVP